MDGIQIPEEVARQAGVPDDLDSAQLGPYRFPSPTRRKVGARILQTAALLSVLGALANLGNGLWWMAVAFLALAYLHELAAWPLTVHQTEALDRAAAAVTFPVGHASAALGFVGFRSRPVWNVIVYSHESPPARRSLVRIDAVTGNLMDEVYTESLPVPSGG